LRGCKPLAVKRRAGGLLVGEELVECGAILEREVDIEGDGLGRRDAASKLGFLLGAKG
jgi:hypothetical protein